MTRVIAGRYRLVRKLGQGAMGRVWAAWDELLEREVALKEVLLPQGMSDGQVWELRERTLREARAIARLAHPNIVRFFDVVQDDGLPWIVMELVPSRSLYELVREHGPLAPVQVARIGRDLVAALRAAHAEGVLHRDVKPANVLVAENGRVVLTDFGLVALAGDSGITTTGILVGSPSYMAPERALDGPVGPPADLWSLGATLYLAVEGEPPYLRSSAVGTLAALATELPRRPRRAGVLQAALDGLLEKDPARRIDADTAERLLREAAGESVPAVAATKPKAGYSKTGHSKTGPATPPTNPGPAASPTTKPSRRVNVWLAAGALVLAAALAAVVIFRPFDVASKAQAHGSAAGAPVGPLRSAAVSAAPSASVASALPSLSPAATKSATKPVDRATSRPAAGVPAKPTQAGRTPDTSKFTTVYYLAHTNNLYVSADDEGASPLIAFPDSPGPWETFDEVDLGNGEIALRAEINNRFVTATASGSQALVARSNHITTAEKFSLIFNADGSISLRSQANGKYVTVPSGTAQPLINSKTAIGSAEEFTRSIIGQSG